MMCIMTSFWFLSGQCFDSHDRHLSRLFLTFYQTRRMLGKSINIYIAHIYSINKIIKSKMLSGKLIWSGKKIRPCPLEHLKTSFFNRYLLFYVLFKILFYRPWLRNAYTVLVGTWIGILSFFLYLPKNSKQKNWKSCIYTSWYWNFSCVILK